MKDNIVLIGMPGASKSSVGRQLARSLQMMFMDTDSIIEYEYAMPISELIEKSGEEYFRKVESSAILRLEDMSNIAVAVGGGAVLSEKNRRILKENAYCVWLKAKPLTLYDRLKADENVRPLLQPLSIKKISATLKKREKLYRETADIELSTDGLTIEQTVEAVKRALSELIE